MPLTYHSLKKGFKKKVLYKYYKERKVFYLWGCVLYASVLYASVLYASVLYACALYASVLYASGKPFLKLQIESLWYPCFNWWKLIFVGKC